MVAPRHGEAHRGVAQSLMRMPEFKVGGAALHRLQRPLVSLLGKREIDLFGVFGTIGENHHVIGQHLHHAAADRHVAVVLSVDPNHQFAMLQRGERRLMMRQYAEHAVGAGSNHHAHPLVEQLALYGQYLQAQAPAGGLRRRGIGVT